MSETQKQYHPLLLLLIYFGYIIGGYCIGQFIASIGIAPFMQGGKLIEVLVNPKDFPEYKNVVLFLLGATSFGGFILSTLFFQKRFFNDIIFFSLESPQELYVFAAMLAVVFSLPAITFLAEWNQQMVMPDFMNGFEIWAKNEENKMKIMTEYITFFSSNSQFFFGLIVIALIPAIGEEFVFRGVVQNIFTIYFKNIHISIWLAAILFSAIHMQFYGFLPRMLLGAMFGYLYVWSGNMLVPMAGHFVNNGFSLFLLHMKNTGNVKMDVETTSEMPLSMILGSFAIVFAILAMIKWHSDKLENIED